MNKMKTIDIPYTKFDSPYNRYITEFVEYHQKHLTHRPDGILIIGKVGYCYQFNNNSLVLLVKNGAERITISVHTDTIKTILRCEKIRTVL